MLLWNGETWICCGLCVGRGLLIFLVFTTVILQVNCMRKYVRTWDFSLLIRVALNRFNQRMLTFFSLTSYNSVVTEHFAIIALKYTSLFLLSAKCFFGFSCYFGLTNPVLKSVIKFDVSDAITASTSIGIYGVM